MTESVKDVQCIYKQMLKSFALKVDLILQRGHSVLHVDPIGEFCWCSLYIKEICNHGLVDSQNLPAASWGWRVKKVVKNQCRDVNNHNYEEWITNYDYY